MYKKFDQYSGLKYKYSCEKECSHETPHGHSARQSGITAASSRFRVQLVSASCDWNLVSISR